MKKMEDVMKILGGKKLPSFIAVEEILKEIDNNWYRVFKNYPDSWSVRDEYVRKYSWFILNSEIAEILSKYIGKKKAVDVGCGSGYLVYHLNKLGCDNLIGMDKYEVTENGYFNILSSHTDIAIVDEFHNGDFSDYEIVICTWPSLDSHWFERVLRNMKSGQTLIYQGEDYGGCTATDGFFEILEKDFEVVKNITQKLNFFHLQFPGLHDDWSVYKKK